MNLNLFKSILAMDAYNRSYNQGIVLSGNLIGTATIIKDSADLGFIESTSSRKDKDAGFYAIAYKLDSGENVISYRGTDSLLGSSQAGGSDFNNGYGVGTGSVAGAQAKLAFQFYNAVAKSLNNNNPIDPRDADITLTGHSLGGGLAGLVGADISFTGH